MALRVPLVLESGPTVQTSEEGGLAWERGVTRVALPEVLEPKTPVPGKEVPGLYAVAVAVRWGHNHMVEVDTLRAPTGPATAPATNPADQQGQTGQGGAIPGGAAGSGGAATPGRSQTGPFGMSSSSSSGTTGTPAR